MKTIVSVYRFIIALFFIIALALLIFVLATGAFRGDGLGFVEVAGGFAMFFLFVIAIGATATFISIHDRICELVDLQTEQLAVNRDKGD